MNEEMEIMIKAIEDVFVFGKIGEVEA